MARHKRRGVIKKRLIAAPSTPRLELLSIDDLKRLEASVIRYQDRSEIYSQTYRLNQDARATFAASAAAEIAEIEKTRSDYLALSRNLLQKIWPQQIGVISSYFGRASIEYHGMKFPDSCAPTIEQLSMIDNRIAALYQKMEMVQAESRDKSKKLDAKRAPNPMLTLQVSGIRTSFDATKISLDEIRSQISAKQKAREFNESASAEAIENLKARAAGAESERRSQAQQYRNRFSEQVAQLPHCPYCLGSIELASSHLDHIYPIAKGGQSSFRNLVFVCATCNIRKRDLTLRTFAKKYSFDYHQICDCLEKLSKDI